MSALLFSELESAIFPISQEVYHKLLKSGEISEKTELMEGIIIKKMTKGTLHVYYLIHLQEKLQSMIPTGYFMRVEAPLNLGESELEPDISVVKGNKKDFIYNHPNSASLVIEISDSSLTIDRKKLAVYARAGIENCWILDINNKRMEAYSQPSKNEYLMSRIYNSGETVSSPFGEFLLDLLEEV